MSKIKESMVKNNIDPQLIDSLQVKLIKVEKDFELKLVEAASKIKELKDQMEQSYTNKK